MTSQPEASRWRGLAVWIATDTGPSQWQLTVAGCVRSATCCVELNRVHAAAGRSWCAPASPTASPSASGVVPATRVPGARAAAAGVRYRRSRRSVASPSVAAVTCLRFCGAASAVSTRPADRTRRAVRCAPTALIGRPPRVLHATWTRRCRLASTNRRCAPAAARSSRHLAGRAVPSPLGAIVTVNLGAQPATSGQLEHVVDVAACARSCGSLAMEIRICAASAGRVQ